MVFISLAVAAIIGLLAPAAQASLSPGETKFIAEEFSAPRYGVTMEKDSLEDLLSDHARWQMRRMRREFADTGTLSPETISEAKHLRRQRYSLLAKDDRAFIDALFSMRLGGFSVQGPDSLVIIPAAYTAKSKEAPPAQDFQSWLRELREEASRKGVPDSVLDDALTGLTVDSRILAGQNSQPEHKKTFEDYLSATVSESRVNGGRERMSQYAAMLAKASAAYGVPAAIIVSLWGQETTYGRWTGEFSVVRSLATLAYAGRRASFFRKELIEALLILAEEKMPSRDLKGSWAGAMGQCQFMPSSFRRLAADGDNDGRRDIWKNHADVFASIANYLSKAGWDPATTWGQAAVLPDNFDQSLADLKVIKPISSWREFGVKAAPQEQLPAGGLKASVIRPSGPGGRAFLAYPNFRVIMDWNRSTYFATSVGLLADRISR